MSSNPKFLWPDFLKGVAMIGVCFEHWTASLPHRSDIVFLEKLATLTGFSGILIHQFFLLSGFGLACSYLNKGVPSWTRWGQRRFAKIVVPYWAIVSATFLVLLFLPHAPDFSFSTLLAYLTFTRNFFPDTWALNSSFWFMPVLVGLYLVFPLLALLMDRKGPVILGIVAVVVTMGSSAILILAGYPVDHQAAHFVSFLAPFAAGMILAFVVVRNKVSVDRFVGLVPFILGVILVGLSAVLVNTFTWGGVANDTFTALGMFLLLLNFYHLLPKLHLQPLAKFFSLFGRHSYTVYLIHLPLIQFAAAPLILASQETVSSPLLLAIEILSIPFFLLLALLLAPLLSSLSKLAQPKRPA